MNRSLHGVRLGAFSIVSLVSIQVCAAQTTVTVSPAQDNTLYEDPTGSLSNGAGPSIFVGEQSLGLARRAVLRFDVASAVPAGAKVVAASLSLSVALSADFSPLPTAGHRLTQAWGEGTSVALSGGGGGGPATTGDATWKHTFFSTSNWTSPGGDFAALPSFTMSLPVFGPATADPQPGLVADVQSWIDSPATNFGWLLKAQTEASASTARRINSREAPSGQPILSITYLLPSETATWGTGCPSPLGTYAAAWAGAMVGGSNVAMLHAGGPALGIGANYFALELNHPGALLYPSCNVYLPLSGAWIPGNVFLFDGAGFAASPWTVPTGYPGLYFMSQSLALESTAPLGLTLANAIVAVIQ